MTADTTDFTMAYGEMIETQGVLVPFVSSIVTPKIEKAMRKNRYESGEAQMLRTLLQPGDRVLELGAGIGLCSAIAAGVEGVDRVVTVEANPALIPMINETHRVNHIKNVDVRNAVVSADVKGSLDFYVRRDFWASSMEPDSRAYEKVVRVPALDFGVICTELRPTVILCDIEGGEFDIFTHPNLDLSGVRLMIVEFHEKVYSKEGVDKITTALAAQGMHPIAHEKEGGSVQIFGPLPEVAAAQKINATVLNWPIPNPRILLATCMKDEGPFILEWLAWHRAIGVTDFIIFTNDCSDGTAELLDRLADMGEITHLPNPALGSGAANFQPVALKYMQYLRPYRSADFVISADVDEFINIRPGDGMLSDLFAATGPFDALSICEVNHGSNGRVDFEAGWIKDQFLNHDTISPGNKRSRRGVKTITRMSDRVKAVRNHRPDFQSDAGPVLWLDGSGNYLHALQADATENGIDARGTYDLVSLEHYPLRSLNSYFMKMIRGDVVVANKSVSQRYWRERNRNNHTSSVYNTAADVAARAYHAERYESDAALMQLHAASCAFHSQKIKEILKMPEIVQRRAWIMNEAWDDLGAPLVDLPETETSK